MIQIFRNPRFDFMGKRVYGYVFSALIIGASLFQVYQHRARTGDALNYGIDFRGGTIMQVRFQGPPDLSALRGALEQAGFSGASIQGYGAASENSILIRVSEQLEESHDLVDRIRKALRPAGEQARFEQGLLDLNTSGEADIAEVIEREVTGLNAASPDPVYMRAARGIVARRGEQQAGMLTDFAQLGGVPELSDAMAGIVQRRAYLGSVAFLKTESIGPTVGQELRSKALVATVVACGLILVYLWFRFELRFGVAAVLCLVHDVVFILGVFAMTDREFDLTVLAAILTVIGYSVNDTIVIFDRVRSNLKIMRRETLEEILNRSINQTLSRSVLTSGLTLLAVVSLFVYGGEVLEGFAFALLIGIVEGSYSTIFIASPLLLVWRRLFGQS